VTKTRPTAQLEEPQAKHQSRPVDERVAAAVALPLLGYSIQEFCTAVGISLSFFYELKQAGLAPRAMKLGTRRIISVEEAQKWCRERTEASVKVVREAPQPCFMRAVGREKRK
jgi:predicted DNA-binding transcriptional regulator AlpA